MELAEEVIKIPMHKVLRPHVMEMTEALHLLAKKGHWVKGQHANFCMSPSNIKHINSGERN